VDAGVIKTKSLWFFTPLFFRGAKYLVPLLDKGGTRITYVVAHNIKLVSKSLRLN